MPDTNDKKGIHRLVDLTVQAVDAVTRGANKRPFLIVKQEDGMKELNKDAAGNLTTAKTTEETEEEKKRKADAKAAEDAEAEKQRKAAEGKAGEEDEAEKKRKADAKAAEDDEAEKKRKAAAEVDPEEKKKQVSVHQSLLDEKVEGLKGAITKLAALLTAKAPMQEIRTLADAVSELSWQCTSAASNLATLMIGQEAKMSKAADVLKSAGELVSKAYRGESEQAAVAKSAQDSAEQRLAEVEKRVDVVVRKLDAIEKQVALPQNGSVDGGGVPITKADAEAALVRSGHVNALSAEQVKAWL